MKIIKHSKVGHLIGIGYDNRDGHTRITNGDDFSIIGGSKETHECLQEKAVKFNECLKKRGKSMHNITPREFFDIIDRIS
jgi:hypothetical protein